MANFFSSWIYLVLKSGGGVTLPNFLPYNNQPEKVVDGREFVLLQDDIYQCYLCLHISKKYKEILRNFP